MINHALKPQQPNVHYWSGLVSLGTGPWIWYLKSCASSDQVEGFVLFNYKSPTTIDIIEQARIWDEAKLGSLAIPFHSSSHSSGNIRPETEGPQMRRCSSLINLCWRRLDFLWPFQVQLLLQRNTWLIWPPPPNFTLPGVLPLSQRTFVSV